MLSFWIPVVLGVVLPVKGLAARSSTGKGSREAPGADAAGYDAWYSTAQGAWIGEIEFDLLQGLLSLERGETLLDVGCGTGYFTRRFADASSVQVLSVDPNEGWLQFARAHGAGTEPHCAAGANDLPFADRSFDRSASVTALCLVEDFHGAIREILRVTRKRFCIGLLNRHSLRYLRTGRAGGSGACRGAHWHTSREIRTRFEGLPAANLKTRSAVFVAGGGPIAPSVEHLIPGRRLLGAFIVVAGDVPQVK